MFAMVQIMFFIIANYGLVVVLSDQEKLGYKMNLLVKIKHYPAISQCMTWKPVRPSYFLV